MLAEVGRTSLVNVLLFSMRSELFLHLFGVFDLLDFFLSEFLCCVIVVEFFVVSFQIYFIDWSARTALVLLLFIAC